MPNTLGHLGIQTLATRGVLAQIEAKRFFALDGSVLAYNQARGAETLRFMEQRIRHPAETESS